MFLSFKSQIPNHPETCLGVKSPNYSLDQCRLCWLAAYDRGYRREWGINKRNLEVVQTVDEKYACIHRGTDAYIIPGCSFCNGGPPARDCFNPQIQSKCVITGPDTFLSNARAKGYRICEECGYRESKSNLEMLPSHFKLLLDKSPKELPEGWENWEVTKIAYREYFQELCKEKVSPPTHFSGRGIVIGAGGETYFKNAWCVVNHLRKHGCTLPIQFWYLGFQEMDPVMLAAANAIGVECVDATQVAVKPRILNGWELKPFSVMYSPFEEVLYLDADSFPVKNPEYLFDLPEYQELGAIFWPDLPPQGRKYWIPPEVWEQYGLLPDSGPDLESGQFLVNKSRCWHEMKVTMWLNEHSDWVYKHVYGDKSTYNLAWAGCDTDYVLPRKLPDWDRPIILQYDLTGDLVFQHCCQGKQHLANSLPIPNLNNHQWALEAMEELKGYWCGEIYKQTGDLILGQFTMRTTRPFEVYGSKLITLTIDEKEIKVDLLQGGYIRGATLGFRSWRLLSDTELLFVSKGKATHKFLKNLETNQWEDPVSGLVGTFE